MARNVANRLAAKLQTTKHLQRYSFATRLQLPGDSASLQSSISQALLAPAKPKTRRGESIRNPPRSSTALLSRRANKLPASIGPNDIAAAPTKHSPPPFAKDAPAKTTRPLEAAPPVKSAVPNPLHIASITQSRPLPPNVQAKLDDLRTASHAKIRSDGARLLVDAKRLNKAEEAQIVRKGVRRSLTALSSKSSQRIQPAATRYFGHLSPVRSYRMA